jgi:hypothetical protein
MGLFKDWLEDNNCYRFRRKVIYFFSPRVWLRLHKWRKQRADRGWSDRDAWGAGDHIVQMTAEMLQYLNDYSYCDWPEWFKLNVQEKGRGVYHGLQPVIDDMNNYLEVEKTSWSDGLETVKGELDDIFVKDEESGNRVYKSPGWMYVETGKKLTDKQIRARIKKWSNEQRRAFNKASKAMQFFSRHFWGFWDVWAFIFIIPVIGAMLLR